jgi:hypothetical protein
MNLLNIAVKKTKSVKKIISQAAHILLSVGVPMNDLTIRRIEKMSMSFLALCDLRQGQSWAEA